MFPEMNNILGIDVPNVPRGKFILIRECDTNAEFVLQHLLGLFLRNKHNVCFLTAAQSQSHYAGVSNKLGVVFKNFIDSGNLIVVEALKHIGEYITAPTECNCTPRGQCGRGQCEGGRGLCQCVRGSEAISTGDCGVELGRTDTHDSLKQLYCELKSHYTSLQDGDSKRTLLLIDDVTVFLHLGIPVIDVIHFVHYLRMLVCPSTSSAGCLAALVHHEVEAADDDVDLLIRQLSHVSNMSLLVSGLQSGFCRDVDGEVSCALVLTKLQLIYNLIYL